MFSLPLLPACIASAYVMDCLRYDVCVGAVAEIDGVGVDTAGIAYRDHDLPVAYESDESDENGKALQT